MASLHTSKDLSKTGEGNVLYSSASPVGGGEKEGVGKGGRGVISANAKAVRWREHLARGVLCAWNELSIPAGGIVFRAPFLAAKISEKYFTFCPLFLIGRFGHRKMSGSVGKFKILSSFS